jgi:hypothetical protein
MSPFALTIDSLSLWGIAFWKVAEGYGTCGNLETYDEVVNSFFELALGQSCGHIVLHDI